MAQKCGRSNGFQKKLGMSTFGPHEPSALINMLRNARRLFGSLTSAEDLSLRITQLHDKLAKHLPTTTADLAARNLTEPRELSMEEKLAFLDAKVANIEALREAGRPEEERVKNLPNKYGRAGRHPGYQWYGAYVKSDDRLPHVSDRLGKYSDVAPKENQGHEWLKLRSDLNNPTFGSHFVKEPNREPDFDLNFEKGEVIYENPNTAAGVRLVRQVGGFSFFYIVAHLAHMASTGRSTYPIGEEFCDIRADHRSYSDQNWLSNLLNWGPEWHNLDVFGALSFASPLVPLLCLTFMQFMRALTKDQVVQLQFNKDKDLVFVTKMRGAFRANPYEEVFETTHLQVLPPSVRTGDDVSKDQLLTISCMNTGESFILYKDEQYWNPKESNSFKKHLYKLWG